MTNEALIGGLVIANLSSIAGGLYFAAKIMFKAGEINKTIADSTTAVKDLQESMIVVNLNVAKLQQDASAAHEKIRFIKSIIFKEGDR